MAGRSLTEAERADRYNMTIVRAIKCAGGYSAVARRLGVSESTPRQWARLPGHVPDRNGYRETICEMGGGHFTPDQLTSRQEAASA